MGVDRDHSAECEAIGVAIGEAIGVGRRRRRSRRRGEEERIKGEEETRRRSTEEEIIQPFTMNDSRTNLKRT